MQKYWQYGDEGIMQTEEDKPYVTSGPYYLASDVDARIAELEKVAGMALSALNANIPISPASVIHDELKTVMFHSDPMGRPTVRTPEQQVIVDMVLEEISKRLLEFDQYPFEFSASLGYVERSEIFQTIAAAITAQGKRADEVKP
jgi:hypothetical protein